MKLIDDVNAMELLDDELKQLESEREVINVNQIVAMRAKLQFAQQLQIINQQYALELKRRINEIERTKQFNVYRDNYSDVIDGYENPHERGKKYTTMEQVIAEINQERMKESHSPENRCYKNRGEVDHGNK